MATHAQKLERWLGAEQCENISKSMLEWYGPPIPVAGVPGGVYAAGGGDFVGPIRGGGFASFADFAAERIKGAWRRARQKQLSQCSTGFSSLSDLISEATAGGKAQDWFYFKSGSVATSGAFASLWNTVSFPPAGAGPSALPGGSVPTNATAGAVPFTNPGGADTLHITTIQSQGSAAPNTLMLYDRTFHASSVSHGSTSNQSVSGTPTRYTTTASPGVFAFIEVTTSLGATAQNLTMSYTDQAGNTAEAAAALAIVTSSVTTRIPHSPWFIPLNSGDTGIRTVTNLIFSAANTGASNLVMGRALAMVPQPVANSMVVMDGINSAFSLKQVQTNACLSFVEFKGVASATSYMGTMTLVSG